MPAIPTDADCNNNVVATAAIPTRKRKSEDDSSSNRPSKYLQTSNSTSSITDEVLQNGLILQAIFKNLPTRFLLNSCSLVCKNWKSEARTFIRDNRKCTIATRPLRRFPCSILKGFDGMCRKMTRAGRVAPFNSFVVINYEKDCKCSGKNSPLTGIEQFLTSHLKLQHVTIDCQGWEECGNLSQLLLQLLRLKGSQVRSMEIEHAHLFGQFRKISMRQVPKPLNPLEQFFMSNSDDEDSQHLSPRLPQLQEVIVSYTGDLLRSSQEVFIKNLLKNAPNLKKMLIKDGWLCRYQSTYTNR